MTAPKDEAIEEGSAGSETSRSLVVPALVVAILVLLLPLFYVLSIGPVIALEARGYLEIEEDSPIVYFYWPILWSAESFQFVEGLLEWYADLWDG